MESQLVDVRVCMRYVQLAASSERRSCIGHARNAQHASTHIENFMYVRILSDGAHHTRNGK